jgi:hypothetical protein
MLGRDRAGSLRPQSHVPSLSTVLIGELESNLPALPDLAAGIGCFGCVGSFLVRIGRSPAVSPAVRRRCDGTEKQWAGGLGGWGRMGSWRVVRSPRWTSGLRLGRRRFEVSGEDSNERCGWRFRCRRTPRGQLDGAKHGHTVPRGGWLSGDSFGIRPAGRLARGHASHSHPVDSTPLLQ